MGVGAESVMITGPIFFCSTIVQADNDIKRSSPLSSAGVLSSEGLCSSHLALLRQLTSALLPTAPARLCKSSASLLRMHSRFTQTRSTHRTHGPRAVTLLQTVTSAYAQMPSSRWSSLMKSGQAL